MGRPTRGPGVTESFRSRGHSFWRAGTQVGNPDGVLWRCRACGAIQWVFAPSRVPSTASAFLKASGSSFSEQAGHFRTCADALAASVMGS